MYSFLSLIFSSINFCLKFEYAIASFLFSKRYCFNSINSLYLFVSFSTRWMWMSPLLVSSFVDEKNWYSSVLLLSLGISFMLSKIFAISANSFLSLDPIKMSMMFFPYFIDGIDVEPTGIISIFFMWIKEIKAD